MKLRLNFIGIFLLPVTEFLYAAAPQAELFQMPFEDLMNVEVISIAKKPQSVNETAAAIHVISQQDIRRSGATSLPEVLRGVPGLHVAQISANNWAISIRGFNDRFANKLLVLVDGRSVYTPIFAGVYWNMQDMLLEDIERIEVVRGAGGTLWGANAVNGVINIITKRADKTQGTQLSFLGGSQDLVANARYGGQLNQDTHYRIFAQGRRVDNFKDSVATEPANDRWKNVHAGFRLDSKINSDNDLLIEGSYNNGDSDQTTTNTSLTPIVATKMVEDEVDYQTGNFVARWNHHFDTDNKLQIQGYYDYFERIGVDTKLLVHTMDIDMQHQIKLFDDHDFIWGLGYRGVYDELESDFTVSFNPKFRYASTFSGFIQDEIRINDALRLTLGSKFEHNDYTGFEYQPSARLLWRVNQSHSFWTSVSRSVRVPSRSLQDMRINAFAVRGFVPPSFTPTLGSIFGNKDLKSENVYSAEIGYRALFSSKMSVDITGFYNYYDDLKSQEQSRGFGSSPVAHNLIISTTDNQMTATSYGAEISAKWQVFDFWQLAANYSWLKLDAQRRANSTTPITRVQQLENADPQHQASLRSTWQLPLDLEFNTSVYYTDSISAHHVQDNTRLDLRLAWAPTNHFELSVVGQNLLDGQNKEYTASDVFYTEVPRSVYAKISTRF